MFGVVRRVLGAAAVLALLAVGPSTGGDASADLDAIAAGLESEILRIRERARAGRVGRSADLDRVARARARAIAGAPAGRRLPPPAPLEDLLAEEPALRDRRVSELIDVQRGMDDPVRATSRAWRDHTPSWELIVDSRTEAIGLGVARADDGTLVVVGVLLESIAFLSDLGSLERDTERAINRARKREGARALRSMDRLREIARAHSADMAKRRFFAHESPDGLSPGDRARSGGVSFQIVGENIGKSDDMDDPVAAIVDGWLNSPGHRTNLMNSTFTHTGVGVALDDDGMIYFTQLFIRRSSSR